MIPTDTIQKITWINPKEISPLEYDGYMLFLMANDFSKKAKFRYPIIGIGYIFTLPGKKEITFDPLMPCPEKMETIKEREKLFPKINFDITIDDIHGWIPFPEDYAKEPE